ncbi:MAG: hypothetical protein LBE09_03065 [Christensenellaceae bacterium]|nr:hypothetical protein [Christensenellaceae bacterium]
MTTSNKFKFSYSLYFVSTVLYDIFVCFCPGLFPKIKAEASLTNTRMSSESITLDKK